MMDSCQKDEFNAYDDVDDEYEDENSKFLIFILLKI